MSKALGTLAFLIALSSSAAPGRADGRGVAAGAVTGAVAGALSRECGRARDMGKGSRAYAAVVALAQCWAASALKRRSVRRATR
jgi:hypothetical protein